MRPAEIKQIRFTTRCGLHDSAGEIHDLTQRSLMASRRHSESNLNPYQFPRDLAAASQTDSLFRGRSRPLRSGHPTDRAPRHPPAPCPAHSLPDTPSPGRPPRIGGANTTRGPRLRSPRPLPCFVPLPDFSAFSCPSLHCVLRMESPRQPRTRLVQCSCLWPRARGGLS